MNKKKILSVFVLVLIASVLLGYKYLVLDRNKPVLDTRWAGSSQSSSQVVDHALWQSILDDYLVTDTDSDVNLFDYSGLLDDGRESLDQYVVSLTSVDPLTLSRAEQKPYWINLYNAATVALILDNYPLRSITEIDGPVGSFGPWDNDAVTINSISLSLNDIEHRIIRPLFNDYRIHFAVNCASIGCPDLSSEVFTQDNMESLLDAAADEFISHPRGLTLADGQLQLSSLFEWFLVDFGKDESHLLTTLASHAQPDVRSSLASYSGSIEYAYDWSLNGYCSIDNECGQ